MKERDYVLFKVKDFSAICPNEYWSQCQNNYHVRYNKLRKDIYE